MKRFTLCFVYLFISICNVQSASYYYRAGRDVIVPSVDEMISDQKVVPLEKLELISADEPTKITTVAETVKNAAVEAIQTQNEEIVPVVSDVKSIEKMETVEPVVSEVQSNVVVDEAKSIVAVEPVANVPSVVETIELKTNNPEVPVQTVAVKETPISNVEIEQKPNVKVVQQVIEEVKSSNLIPTDTVNNEGRNDQPNNQIRQTNPIENFGQQIQTVVQNFQHTIQQIPVINALIPRPASAAGATSSSSIQSDTEISSQNAESESQSSTSSNANQQQSAASSSTSPPPNLLQNALNSITSFLAPRTTTAPPAVVSSEAVPAIVSGTRGDESVQVVQNIEIVDDKVDYAKQAIV